MKCKLGDIAFINMGQSPSSKCYNSYGNGVPFLQGNRTFGYLYPSIVTYTTEVTKLAEYGDILLSVRAPVGDLNIAPCKLCVGRGLCSLQAKNGNQFFLYYYLKQNIKFLIRQSNGTTFTSLTKDVLADFEVEILPNINQEKISNVLFSLDEKINHNLEIKSILESLAKTIYDYWFLQFDFPNEEGKPYKSSDGAMVWNEELKMEIPVGWSTKKLGDIILEKPKSNIQVGQASNKGNIPFFTSGDAILNCEKSITSGRNCFLNTGGVAGLKFYVGDASYSTDTWCISGKEGLPDYLYLYLLKILPYFDKVYFAGSTLKHLQKPLLKNRYICVPSNSILNQFNRIVQPLFDMISENTRQNQELVNLRDFLLPLLMNGQVGFKDK